MSRRSRGIAWGGWPGVVAVTMVVSGCGYHEAHHVNFGAPRGVSGEPEILVDALPDRRFSELGLVEAMGQGTEATRARVLRVLQAEAKAQGCDAVAKVRVTTGQTMTHAIGVCVAWVGP